MNQKQSQTSGGHPKRLYRSATDRKLAGVCGGLAVYFGLDASLIRLSWIAVTILTGFVPGVVGYIVAVIVVPPERARE